MDDLDRIIGDDPKMRERIAKADAAHAKAKGNGGDGTGQGHSGEAEKHAHHSGDEQADGADLSRDALALAMGQLWRDARHVAAWGQWLFWDRNRWLTDDRLFHLTRTRHFLRDKAAALVEASVCGLARCNPGQVATVGQWDKDRMLLGTPGGTVDLRSGILRPAQPENYITKSVAVAPAPAGEQPVLWLAFLDRITGGSAELKAYLQRMAGYCLTGSVSEHAVFFLYGTGSNGKTVFVNTLRSILSDYGATITTEMLMVSNGTRHPTEIARLRGARLVAGTEVEVGGTWAESKIKSLTGGDQLQGHFMRQDIFEFDPQFKMVLGGNNKPSLRGVDEAMRRRLHLVPFTITIPEHERNKNLEEELRAEAPAILGWMIEGCSMWQEQGLNPPDIVRLATANYLDAEDAFELWRQDCTSPNPNGWESSSDLWKSWKRWAEAAGEVVGKQRSFSDLLETRGFVPAKKGKASTRGFRGADLKRHDYTDETRYGG